MKTWAEINSNNIVINVVKVADEKKDAQTWLQNRLGGSWIQSYAQEDIENGTDSKRHGLPAAKNFTWDSENEIFVSPQPFPSWTFSLKELKWIAPVSKPEDAASAENPDGTIYKWDEETTSWVAAEAE